MDKVYHMAYDEIRRTLAAVKAAIAAAPTLEAEDVAAYQVIDLLRCQLNETKSVLRYLGSRANEGQLREEPCGGFVIVYDDGSESSLLSCDSPLEIRDPYPDPEYSCGWLIGRVGVRSMDDEDQYCFSGDRCANPTLRYREDEYSSPVLKEGMIVRKRDVKRY